MRLITGKEIAKANITAGSTNIEAYVRIMPTNPYFVSPTSLMTAISKDLDSTEARSSEKTRRFAMIKKRRRSTSKIRPMNITGYS